MSQSLYDLPEGWKWERLGDVLDVRDGTHDSPKFVETGFPLVTSKNLTPNGLELTNVKYISKEDYDSINKRSNVDMGDILFAMIGTIGNPVLITDYPEFAIKNVALFKRKKLDQCMEYVRYYLMTPYTINSMTSLSKGATQKFVGLNFLRSFQIPLPPLAEQTRIVEKLDAVLSRIDASIDELQQSLALVDAMFKSGLDGVFEDIYAHSAIKKLSELTTKIGSGATPKGGGSAYKESGISLIRSLNVHDLNFKYDGLAFIDDEQAKALSNVEVSSGDVLLNITGASIARCCIVPDGILPARVNQHVCILRPNHLLNSDFLNYLIVSPKFKSALLFQGAGGATRQALTKAMIENFDIPMPTLNKQAEAIEKIKQINEQTTQLKTELTAKIGMFNQLKASVLDGAFRGLI